MPERGLAAEAPHEAQPFSASEVGTGPTTIDAFGSTTPVAAGPSWILRACRGAGQTCACPPSTNSALAAPDGSFMRRADTVQPFRVLAEPLDQRHERFEVERLAVVAVDKGRREPISPRRH